MVDRTRGSRRFVRTSARSRRTRAAQAQPWSPSPRPRRGCCSSRRAGGREPARHVMSWESASPRSWVARSPSSREASSFSERDGRPAPPPSGLQWRRGGIVAVLAPEIFMTPGELLAPGAMPAWAGPGGDTVLHLAARCAGPLAGRARRLPAAAPGARLVRPPQEAASSDMSLISSDFRVSSSAPSEARSIFALRHFGNISPSSSCTWWSMYSPVP